MVEDTPPGDALPPPPQRATPARKGARCGAGAGSPRPHRPHPGHTGRGTLAARSRGRAAGGGTAPDTRRASQRWQATAPGDGPPPAPRHAAPTGRAGQGGNVGPPHPHTSSQSTWVADPDSPPSGRAVGGGTAPDLRRPSQWWKAPPPGDAPAPPPQRATPARKGARCGAGAGSPRPHRPHPGHTGRGTQTARSRGRAAGGGTAPDTRRPSQRWQATPPGDGPPPPPRHAAPTGHAGQGDSVGPPHPHTRAHSTWVADPNSPPSGRAVGGGTAPDLRRPSQWWKTPPPGDALPPPPQRATPARKGARCGAGAGSPRPHRPHPGHTGRGTPAARSRGRAAGGGTAPDTRRPLTTVAGHPPPGTAPHHPRGTQPPQGMQAKGTVLGPHTHTLAPTARGWRTPTARPVGGQSGEGQRLTSDVPHNGGRHPPPGTPFRHPHSEQRRPARAHAVGPVLGPHARTDRTRDTRVAEPRLPAPEDGRPGEGQRLTPDAPSQRWQATPPRGRPPTTPAARSPHRACRPRGQCWAPTPTHSPPQHVGGGPQQPAKWAGSRGRDSA